MLRLRAFIFVFILAFLSIYSLDGYVKKTAVTIHAQDNIETSISTSCSSPSFATTRSFMALSPASIALSDINNDGKIDVTVGSSGHGEVHYFTGDGTGNFAATGYVVSANPFSVAMGDFNEDGKADIAAASYFDHLVRVFLGNGNGTFGAATTFATGTGPYRIVIGDINGDNDQDFVTANYFAGNVTIYLGNGTGGFTQAAGSPVAVSAGTRSVKIQDFNNDNKPDLVTANEDSHSVTVLLGNGTGGFSNAPMSPIAVPSYPNEVIAGDFNGDGNKDFVIAYKEHTWISLFPGNGSGGFGSPNNIIVGSGIRELTSDDFNGDGKPDIATANWDTNSATVLLGNGSGGYTITSNITVRNNPRSIAAGDVNGDNKKDLLVGNFGSSIISVLIGRGDGSFESTPSYPLISGANGLAAGDYNSDGKQDLVASIPGFIAALPNDGNGVFGTANNFAGGGLGPLITDDFNGDNKPDVATVNKDINTPRLSVLINNGQGGFSAATNYVVREMPLAVSSGDFNNDGNKDLLAGTYQMGFSVALGNGNGTFASPVHYPMSGYVMSVGDFNNDGFLDTVTGSKFSPGIRVSFGNGSGTFNPQNGVSSTAQLEPEAILADDFNGDGQSDIAVIGQVLGAPMVTWAANIMLGNGTGSFTNGGYYAVGANPLSIATADFNADGKKDLVVANNNVNSISVLLGSGTGSFSASTFYETGTTPKAVVAADFNQDLKPDIAVANGAGNITFLKNSCTGTFTPPSLISISDTTVTEGDTGIMANIPVSLSVPSDQTVTVGYYMLGQTAAVGADFQPVQGRLTFLPGSTVQTISVPIAGDTIDEFDETIRVTITSPLNANIDRTAGILTIADNDPEPGISINDVSVLEGNTGSTTIQFNATLSAVSGKPISLLYTTADGTATANIDYTPAAATSLQFSPGTITKEISISVAGDTIREPNETFFVNVSDLVNAVVGDGQGIGIIINDEGKSDFDFDGDGKTDISIYRPSNGEWWYQQSSDNTVKALTFGTSTDKITPADFDGDGKTDIAFWRPSTGEWFILRSSNLTFYAAPFGASTDKPAPSDFDGDGKTDFAVFRPSEATWYILKSSGGVSINQFGASGDIPVVGDYDGDSKSDIAIYRPTGSSGQSEWWILRSSNGSVFATPFGLSTDKPVQADYTGDGKTDCAFFRPSSATWFVLRSEDLSFYGAPFGASTDIPTAGDYDGDGKADLAVFRPSGATWFVLKSTGETLIQGFGAANDIPVPSAFVP